jgi:hypothetical protein
MLPKSSLAQKNIDTSRQKIYAFPHKLKRNTLGEARTHGLQIMRLTRCLLRYGSYDWLEQVLILSTSAAFQVVNR